jgi:hypothetical protein
VTADEAHCALPEESGVWDRRRVLSLAHLHRKPPSILHAAEQPSPSCSLPSSHCSTVDSSRTRCRLPSPHTTRLQELRHDAGHRGHGTASVCKQELHARHSARHGAPGGQRGPVGRPDTLEADLDLADRGAPVAVLGVAVVTVLYLPKHAKYQIRKTNQKKAKKRPGTGMLGGENPRRQPGRVAPSSCVGRRGRTLEPSLLLIISPSPHTTILHVDTEPTCREASL